jgi:hypothetical protein
LQCSRDDGFWNPVTVKAFNIIETLKADGSGMAGLISAGWNMYTDRMQGVDLARGGLAS